MKYLKEFENYWTTDSNRNFNESMISSIFTSDYDESIKKLFKEIKDNFDIKKLSYDKGDGSFIYYFDGLKIKSRDDMFFAIPGYTLEIDGENIKCSYLIARKICNFFKKKWKLKNKENVDKFNLKISELGRSSNKYNL